MTTFDADAITAEVVAALQHQLTRLLQDLHFGGADVRPHIEADGGPTQAPITDTVRLLCAAANGELTHTPDQATEVMEARQHLLERLFAAAWMNQYTIPRPFWTTPLGQVVLRAGLWATGDELITLSEAAKLLRGTAENRDLVYVRGLIDAGTFTQYADPNEPNPTKAARLSRREVEAHRDRD